MAYRVDLQSNPANVTADLQAAYTARQDANLADPGLTSPQWALDEPTYPNQALLAFYAGILGN